MDVKSKLFEFSKEQERIFKDLLTKLFNKSIEGLNETLNEVNRLQRRQFWYDFNYYQIPNLKTNINSIQEQYDSNIRNISHQIKEQKQCVKEILSNSLNQLELKINIEENRKYLNELIKQIDHLIENTSYQFLLISIFEAFGLFNCIESILALFTGTGVLGIAPFRMGFVVNNTASEIMFRDKLEELDEKLTYIIQNIRIKKTQELENVNLYFNNFRVKLS